ncbi:IS1595 family transposase [Agrobacterium sp.]|uniref:IS1595 family transposase n=1 Tax=Agrobacterium sp. TaxID=361 RepID=UPI0028AB1BBF|nr:IS1595 family transposase [Agrobacterium sp.]
MAWLDWRCPTEDAAREFVENLVWPDGPHCPHCGSAEAWRFREKGRKSRPGLYECQHCSRQFTVTTKTPMHATKLPLRLWLKAIYLILVSSKGVSSVILGKQLGVRQSTAWKMAHAVREMTDGRNGQNHLLGRIVEVDTTYMGAPPRKKKSRDNTLIKHKRGRGTKRPQIAVAASRDGRVAAQVINRADAGTIGRFLDRFVSKDAVIMSDDDTAIGRAAKAFSGHETVTHRDHEYADGEVHSNTAENLASVLKRAQLGVFHFLSPRHLQRYIDEIIFRMNQREIKRRAYRKGGRVSLELSYISFEEQLKNLLKKAVGRQVRRFPKGGMEWPPPIAPGFKSAPSVSTP